nr:hypothetical protein [Vibrio vulnificus]
MKVVCGKVVYAALTP